MAPASLHHERSGTPRHHRSIHRRLIGLAHMEALYAGQFREHVQPLITATAERMTDMHLADECQFFALSSGGCYMAPVLADGVRVWLDEETQSVLSPDAFGLTATVHALALLQYSGPPGFPETSTAQHRLLCDYARKHPEWAVIRRVTY